MAIDKSKIKTLEKLKEKGFDTANKIRPLEMEEVFENGLENELGNIIGLKKAIKANHSELAWLMDGEDPKPAKKEAQIYADDDRDAGDEGSGIYAETYETGNY
jgi:hypothetical protein